MWLEHPDLPGQLIQVHDEEAAVHAARSGWVGAADPVEPTTAELDAQLLRADGAEPPAEAAGEREA